MSDRVARRRFLGRAAAVAALAAGAGTTAPARAETLDRIRDAGRLRVALYDDFEPFSDNGKGLDAEIAKRLAQRLGVRAEFVSFDAGEDMADDLRNMVWKGAIIGNTMCDVLMHVPVDPVLAKASPQVRIFGAYYTEQVAVVRNAAVVPPILGMDQFTKIRVGVEVGSIADAYLTGGMGGRFRSQVQHYLKIAEAVAALRAGETDAVVGSRAVIEAALGAPSDRYPVSIFTGAGVASREYAVGMAVKQTDGALADALAAGIAAMSADGSLAALFGGVGVSWAPPAA
ncbi:MAG: transporter substrate-binding domain-containing protein [Burkholderiales bacterium]|jgi:ABC-type amino acid transport substrate-binding protein|nr:transporter substrate-binding domain-containing protein [Burkholderiales bacterium]